MTTEDEVKAAIEKAMEGLTPPQQKRVAKRMITEQQAKLERTNGEIAEIMAEKRDLQAQVKGLEFIGNRLDETDGKMILERCESSRLHKLQEALKDGKVFSKNQCVSHQFGFSCHSFLVNHEWSKVVGPAMSDDDEWRLPYDFCAFEFQFSGQRIIALFAGDDEESAHSVVWETPYYWFDLGSIDREFDLGDVVYNQVKAIAIVLDAEVAESDVVRAPYKLNQKREKAGKPKIADYHVINLTKRHRVAKQTNGEGSKKRLHFRRGHWRHYDGWKTWVKWCLVGDPDLGFVDKDYSL